MFILRSSSVSGRLKILLCAFGALREVFLLVLPVFLRVEKRSCKIIQAVTGKCHRLYGCFMLEINQRCRIEVDGKRIFRFVVCIISAKQNINIRFNVIIKCQSK